MSLSPEQTVLVLVQIQMKGWIQELVLTLFNIMRFFWEYCMDLSWLVSVSEDNMMQIFELQIRVKHLLVVILDCLSLTFYAEI